MANVLSPTPKQKFFGNDGKPAVGYKLFTYEAGSSTKLATYPNNSVSVPNSNPIVLDYRGEANIWVPPNVSYKFVLAPPTDTDPPGAPIWSVDDLVSSQLLTLYGGVDSGVANAYVLTFDASFDAYADGIVIYFIASNANTGASTLNVNGLGPVAITRQDGSALTSGQIVANQITQVMYKGTGFVLVFSSTVLATITAPQNNALTSGDYTLTLTDQGNSLVNNSTVDRILTIPPNSSVPFPKGTIIYLVNNVNHAVTVTRGGGVSLYETNSVSPANQNVVVNSFGKSITTLYKYDTDIWFIDPAPLIKTFTITLTGVSGTVTATAKYRIVNGMVFLYIPAIYGTSNSTSCSLTGLPSEIIPVTTYQLPMAANCFSDNSALATGVSAEIQGVGGQILFIKSGSYTGFTAANNKGISNSTLLTYMLVF